MEPGSDPDYHHFLGTHGCFDQQSHSLLLSVPRRHWGVGDEGTRNSPRFGEPTDILIFYCVSGEELSDVAAQPSPAKPGGD